MVSATSHTRKDQRVIDKLDNADYGLEAIKDEIVDPTHGLHEIEGLLEDPNSGLEQARLDRGFLEHAFIHRPRPNPYDVTVAGYLITAHVNADTFGNYVQLAAIGTYDFGDSPNCIQVKQLVIEAMSANDTYIIEFYSFDGSTYTTLGAIRFVRAAVLPRSWTVELPCRCFNNDTHSLQARLKCGAGGNNVNISLSLARMIHTNYYVPSSTGVWPTG